MQENNFEQKTNNQSEVLETEVTEQNTIIENAEEPSAEEATYHRPNAKNKKKKGPVSLLIRAVVIVVVSVLLAALIMSGFKDIYGLSFSESVEKDVYIERGSTTAQIAETLKESGIIDNALLFRVFCKLGDTSGFQYGYHTFSDNMSYEQITNELKKLVKKKDVVEVTVIEGWTLYDIARELKKKDVISDINDFVKTVERMEVTYDYVKDAPEKQYRYYKYEGYFYPDKYEFYTGTDDYEGIAKKFFANFQKHMDLEIENAIKESEYSFDEILTIASLIQAEAGDINEMGKVSSVFHNRLNSALYPNLQSDVTINYVEKVIKPTETYPNQAVYDAYNTYKCTGLMPGPICNPSKAAIRAALFPEKTNYYFFVTDNAGKYYYSNSYAQHLKNCATAQKVNDRLKEGN